MKIHRKASGLLFTVLTLALYTTVSLITVKSILSIIRTTNQLQASRNAYFEAEQGLDQAILLAPAAGVNDPTTPGTFYYSSYTDSTCSALKSTKDLSLTNSNCPYFKYSALGDVTVAANKGYQIPANALQHAPSNNLAIKVMGASYLTFTNLGDPTSGRTVSFTCTCNTIYSGSTDGPSKSFVVSSSGDTIYISVNNPTGFRTQVPSVRISSTQQFTSSRGFTALTSVGYTGGVERRRYANIYGDSPSLLYEYESSDDIDSNGCLANYAPTTSTCFTQRSDGTP